jgi:BACON domain-containing protein/all-beta uncharacterized protein
MRLLRALAPVSCVAALALLVAAGVRPAVRAVANRAERTVCELYLDPHDAFTRVVPPESAASVLGVDGGSTIAQPSAVISNITVNYIGFTPAAQAAFQAAVDIWKTQVSSPIPIVVDAHYEDLGNTSLLGRAGSGVTRDFVGATRPATWFPYPLANRLAGMDLGAQIGPGTSDIVARFNSNISLTWYFGTDGFTPSQQVDFESVVLHELAHGLSFIGTGSVSGGIGTIGSGGFPYIYDAYVVDGNGTSILNTAIYPPNSTQLASALQSDNLFWGGAGGKAADGGARPKLYAPAGFMPGSSYSHLDEATYPAGNVNSLMTPVLSSAEAIHTPGPIVMGMFTDMGWGSQCSFGLDQQSTALPAAGGSLKVTLSTTAGCAWTASSTQSWAAITSATSGTASAVITVSVAPNTDVSYRTAALLIGDQTFTITEYGSGPTMSVDHSSLVFAGASNGAAFITKTSPQIVRLVQSGTGTVTWTVSSSVPWATVTPSSGSGSGAVTISVQFQPGFSPTQTGKILFTFNGAGVPAPPIAVTLNVLQNGTTAAPFGSFDTPADNATGIAGSIPVSGWALDDIEVTHVRILRDPVAGEGASLIFIGDAELIDGARPDVQALYPNVPRNTRAGWGYLLLTNFLPNLGTGTYKLYAFADDAEGHTTLLGTKTITCSNDSSVAPFGAIDTPGQGAVVSGIVNNFGWVLSPGARRADPPGGGTVIVLIDGVNAGSPTGWTSRSDLTALFPVSQYSGIGTAAGVFTFDSTKLSNGIHTIAWIVTANSGETSGIGSRYFTVLNGSQLFDVPQAP